MTTSKNQDLAFNKMIGDELPRSLLQSVIDWIRDNLDAQTVFEPAALVKYVAETKMPDEVFSEAELKRWAIEKGYAPPKELGSIFISG